MTAPWQRMHTEIAERVGVILCTVLAFTNGGATMTRVYSSHPAEYPVGGSKDVATEVSPEWIAVTRDSNGTFFGDAAAIDRIFADARLIHSLGCDEIVNIPLSDAAGAQWGTVNLCAAAGTYTPDAIVRAEEIVARHAAGASAPIEGDT